MNGINLLLAFDRIREKRGLNPYMEMQYQRLKSRLQKQVVKYD